MLVISNKTGLSQWLLIFILLSFITLCIYFTATKQSYRDNLSRLLSKGIIVFFSLGVILRLIYLRIFVSIESSQVPWYWVPEYILFCILGGFICGSTFLIILHILGASKWERTINVATTLILISFGYLYLLVDSGYTDKTNLNNAGHKTFQAALWAKSNIAPEKLCAMYDSGVFSYFSQLDTVPLNGLISDKETMFMSLERRFNAIMQRFGVDYLVAWLNDEQVSSIPKGGLLYISDKKVPHSSSRKEDWLCIVDRKIYQPFDK
jgi:hypothetical protein